MHCSSTAVVSQVHSQSLYTRNRLQLCCHILLYHLLQNFGTFSSGDTICLIVPLISLSLSLALSPLQGTMMGIITAVGSLARVVGPLFVTYMYDMLGPQITFGVVDGILAVAIITLSVFCYRMVPYGQKRRL